MKRVGTKQILLGFTAAILVFVGVGLVLLSRQSPSATIKVIDRSGKPVVGATIEHFGVRSKGGASAFGWPDTNRPVLHTDEHGEAVVRYPAYVMERVETGKITFYVDHPDHPSQRAEQIVDPSPASIFGVFKKVQHVVERLINPAKFRAAPIVLDDGGVVTASAFLGRPDNLVTTNVYIDPRFQLNWNAVSPGTFASRRYTAGTNYIRMVYFPEHGRTHYSDVASFVVRPKQTNIVQVELKPGHRLEVRLGDNVPRPVINGRVALWSAPDYSGNTPELMPEWRSWRKLDTNGICVFESLPAGEVDVIGICDGFISNNGPTVPGRYSVCLPQTFMLSSDQKYELKMERTATCRVVVKDPTGVPLPGATVGFCPNVIGGGIFARNLVNSDELLRAAESEFPKLRTEIDSFSATTDTEGVAVIDKLPGFGQRESFEVWHANFDMPMDQNGEWRTDYATLSSGQTTSITVTMEKKGSTVVKYTP